MHEETAEAAIHGYLDQPRPKRKLKIVKTDVEVTFDQGDKEYVITVNLDNEKQGTAYYKNGSFDKQYRFEDWHRAKECADWLVGREYIGPHIW